jgi:DNA-binding NarL/FixJ family response regulator
MFETVLVVDDHADYRTSTRALLESDGFHVVGEAGTGVDAILAVERLRPNVVVLDIRLPDLDGFTVASRLAALADPPVVVLISSHDARVFGRRIESAAVRGFLPKGELTGATLRLLIG